MAQQPHNQTPVWLDDDSHLEDIQPLRTPIDQLQPPIDNSQNHETQRKVLILTWVLRVTTMALSVLMAVTSILGLGMINGVDKSGKIFVAVYMLFFSTLLFAFELNQIKTIESIDHMFKRNFGFLYSCMGKSFFIIFIAFLSFGLGDPQMLSFVTGCALALFGAAKLAMYLKYPEFFE